MKSLKINRLSDQEFSKRDLKKITGGNGCIFVVTCSTKTTDTTSNRAGFSTKSFPKPNEKPIVVDSLPGIPIKL